MTARTEPPRAQDVYADGLQTLKQCDVPFLVGGAYALKRHAGIVRDTKDLDVFCRAGDAPRLLAALRERGFEPEVTDASWLAKAFRGEFYIDLISSSANNSAPVDDVWFEHAVEDEICGVDVLLVPPEEMIWSKSTVQDRHRNDGSDIYHVIRQSGSALDWHRLLSRMEPLWEILLGHLINYRFVYPADRDRVPEWLMRELLDRLTAQMSLPPSVDRLCRGTLLSRTQYQIDVEEWGYKPG